MLIGSIEEKDVFLNSVLSSVFGSEIYLEKSDCFYRLWMRNYSELEGDRHYDSACLLEQGTLGTCISKAKRVCNVDRSSIELFESDL